MIILKNISKQYNENLENDLFEKLKNLCSQSQNLNYLENHKKYFEKDKEYICTINHHNINTKNFKWFKYFFIKKPINLLFSLDQFLFEFSKKKSQKKRSSEFLQQLREQKKIRFFYGNLSKKELTKIIEKTNKYQGYFYRNFFSIIERRLDVVLYRSGFAKTIPLARQLITHKKILINNKIITIPSYNLKSGDCISVQSKYIDSLSSNLLFSLKNLLKKPYSRKQDLFVNKYQLSKKGSQSFLKKFNHINSDKKSYKISNSLVHLLLKKIDNRANIKIKQYFTSQENLARIGSKNYLALIKYKPLISKQAKYLLFSLKKNNYILSEKKPFFIYSKNFNFFKQQKQKKFTNKQQYKKQNIKYYENKYNNGKKNLFVFKNLILKMFVLMNSQPVFKYFLISAFKKHFFKKRSAFQNMKTFKFGLLKPLNLEISYNLLKIIYLYSPQRLKFPFYINIDLLSRALK